MELDLREVRFVKLPSLVAIVNVLFKSGRVFPVLLGEVI